MRSAFADEGLPEVSALAGRQRRFRVLHGRGEQGRAEDHVRAARSADGDVHVDVGDHGVRVVPGHDHLRDYRVRLARAQQRPGGGYRRHRSGRAAPRFQARVVLGVRRLDRAGAHGRPRRGHRLPRYRVDGVDGRRGRRRRALRVRQRYDARAAAVGVLARVRAEGRRQPEPRQRVRRARHRVRAAHVEQR